MADATPTKKSGWAGLPTWLKIVIVLIPLAFLASLCSGEEATSPDDSAGTDTKEKTAGVECDEAHPRFMNDFIASDKVQVGPGFVQQSENYPGGGGAPIFDDSSVWYVAADIKGEGIGTWAAVEDPTKAPDGGTVIVATNDASQKATKLGIDIPRENRPSSGDEAALAAFTCALENNT